MAKQKIKAPELNFADKNKAIEGDELKAKKTKRKLDDKPRKTKIAKSKAAGPKKSSKPKRRKLTEEERIAHRRASQKKYYEKNKEKIKAKNKAYRELQKKLKSEIAFKLEHLVTSQLEHEELFNKRIEELDEAIKQSSFNQLFNELYYKERLIANGQITGIDSDKLVDKWLETNKITGKNKLLDALTELDVVGAYSDRRVKMLKTFRRRQYENLYNTFASLQLSDYRLIRQLEDIFYKGAGKKAYDSEQIYNILTDIIKNDKSINEIIEQFRQNVAEIRSKENKIPGGKLTDSEVKALLRKGF